MEEPVGIDERWSRERSQGLELYATKAAQLNALVPYTAIGVTKGEQSEAPCGKGGRGRYLYRGINGTGDRTRIME